MILYNLCQSLTHIVTSLIQRQNNLKMEYLKLEKELLLFQSDTLKKVKKYRRGNKVNLVRLNLVH